MQGTQRAFSYIREKANFRRIVCTYECPDTLKYMVACDGYDHCMVPWLPCMCQRAAQGDCIVVGRC